METSSTEADLLIVGAGPVGLSLAAELERLGVAAPIVDRQPAGANTSRACVIHARTLELLAPLDVTEQLLMDGVKVPIFRIRDRDRPLITIDFAQIDSPYPFTLMYPQDRTERLLQATLERLGGSVERSVDFLAFEPDATGIVSTLESGGQRRIVKSRWLVGCDGMHSRVRELAQIPFEGAAYEQGFVLADVRMDWPLSREEVSLFYSPQGLMVVAPLPDEHFRIVATDDADHAVTGGHRGRAAAAHAGRCAGPSPGQGDNPCGAAGRRRATDGEEMMLRTIERPSLVRIVAGAGLLACAAVLWTFIGVVGTASRAQAAVPSGPALFQKYVGSSNSEGFLNEPAVRAELQKMVGAELPRLLKNLNVKGDVDLVSGQLVVSGNAAHAGGEEEGIVCVLPEPLKVEAAIASKGRITLFTRAEKYEYASLCVKDWITQFNSSHRDRFQQPKNVQVVRAK